MTRENWGGIVSAAGLLFLAGYALGRLNALMPVFEWMDRL